MTKASHGSSCATRFALQEGRATRTSCAMLTDELRDQDHDPGPAILRMGNSATAVLSLSDWDGEALYVCAAGADTADLGHRAVIEIYTIEA